jgi:hypothetical protein
MFSTRNVGQVPIKVLVRTKIMSQIYTVKNYSLFLLCGTVFLFAFSGHASAINSSTDSYFVDQLLIAPPDSGDTDEGTGIPFFDGFSLGASAGVGLFHGSLADYNIFAPWSDFSTYYKFAWRGHLEREIIYGIGVKAAFEKGRLAGGRLPGKQSLPVDFESEYNTVSLVITYDVLNELLTGDSDLSDHKFFLNAEVGAGITFYRALSYWRAPDGRIRDFVGYSVTDENPPTQRYSAEDKIAPETAWNLPVGFSFGYRLNYKTDITFNYTLNNLFTDRLDTWSRDFSAYDKYSYFGLGVKYNFNRSKSDYPEKKPKKLKADKKKDKKWSLFGSNKEDVDPKDVALEEPIKSRKSNKIDAANQDEDLDEVKMKMFELQLKLFEMQYLLNGGDPNEQGQTAPQPEK